MTREPLITVATITGAATLLLSGLVAFGLTLTGDQEKFILGAAAFVAPFIVAFVARGKVTPTPTAPPRL